MFFLRVRTVQKSETFDRMNRCSLVKLWGYLKDGQEFKESFLPERN